MCASSSMYTMRWKRLMADFVIKVLSLCFTIYIPFQWFNALFSVSHACTDAQIQMNMTLHTWKTSSPQLHAWFQYELSMLFSCCLQLAFSNKLMTVSISLSRVIHERQTNTMDASMQDEKRKSQLLGKAEKAEMRWGERGREEEKGEG